MDGSQEAVERGHVDATTFDRWDTMNGTSGATIRDETYAIERLEDAGDERLRALDRVVWERERSAEWFRWKYAENPYLDHVPIFVAERDGEVVGARPFMALRLRAGSDSLLALQPADTMVHPEHRRQRVFTRMTQRALEFYESRGPELFFNYPNRAAIGGYRKLGWKAVGPRQAYYRVQTPSTFVTSQVDGPAGRLLGEVATPIARRLYRLRSSLSAPPDGLDVELRDGADAALLASLYERRPPTELHAYRDREFYEWYCSSPAWKYTTAVAKRGTSIEAVLLIRRRTTDAGERVAQLADVAPLTGDDAWATAVSALVGAAVDHAADADLISAVGSAIPRDVLASHALYSANRTPLRQLRGVDSTFVVRPTDPSEPANWQVDGRSLTDPDSWRLTFCEHDTA